MNSAFLAGLDAQLGGGPRRWSDLIIVRNVGPLISSAPLQGDVISNRGFNAILCASNTAATHFLKVRPAEHFLFEREANVTVRLSGHPHVRTLVPASQTFVVERARVLALEFIEGKSLEMLIRTRERSNWEALAADVLRAAVPLWNAFLEVATDGNDGTDRTCATGVGPAGLLADLDLLAAQGLVPHAANVLRTRLQSVPMPLTPQHGDFWPRNVLQVADGWRVLDFEACGDVKLPLYDTFHFLRCCAEAAEAGRGPLAEPWYRVASRSRTLVDEFRHIADGLERGTIEAALVAYLVDFAARLHRRGLAHHRIEGRLRELNELPDLLERGTLQALLN